MSKKMSAAFLALVLLSTGAGAEETDDEKVERPRKPAIPLKLQVVFSRHQGDKKVGSAPYTLSLNADGRPAKLRMGINVPLKYEGKEISGNVVYKTVGTNVQCSAETQEDDRFRVTCSLEQSSVYSANGERRVTGSAGGDTSLLPPILKTFDSEAILLLRDGQTAQHTVATDPVSGEILRADVTLNVVK